MRIITVGITKILAIPALLPTVPPIPPLLLHLQLLIFNLHLSLSLPVHLLRKFVEAGGYQDGYE